MSNIMYNCELTSNFNGINGHKVNRKEKNNLELDHI